MNFDFWGFNAIKMYTALLLQSVTTIRPDHVKMVLNNIVHPHTYNKNVIFYDRAEVPLFTKRNLNDLSPIALPRRRNYFAH
jgi:hypothetical protein